MVGDILEDIIPIMVSNLNPEKDPEVRLKSFSLLSRLLMNAPNTIDSQQRYCLCFNHKSIQQHVLIMTSGAGAISV